MNRNKFTSRFKLTVSALLFSTMFVLAGSALAANGSPSSLVNSRPSLDAVQSGGTLTVTGSGFGKVEIVNVTLEVSDSSGSSNTVLINWPVMVGKDGAFVAVLPFAGLRSPNGKLIVRAMGNGTKVSVSKEIFVNESADLDQCANGPFDTPVQCTGSAWQNGNVGANDGHYYEAGSIPYRVKFDNLLIGGSNTVTIEWDTTQGGKHAIDYITSYDRTEVSPGNNPCSGVVGTHCTNPPTTFPIPLDPNVSGVGVTQLAGQQFTMWGGTITSVSAYTLAGTYAGNSSTRITLTFTASAVNPVLAWGGHIADRNDWATLGGSASDINGSPYHTRVIELNGAGGNQDRSLSATAIRLVSKIVIIKQASPETTLPFGFTATGPNFSFPFTLWDDGVDNDATPNNRSFPQPIEPGGAEYYFFTEDAPPGFYQLQSIICTVFPVGSGQALVTIPARTVKIDLSYGGNVTCTFFNNVTTAAATSVSGRVTDSSGTPMNRTLVSIVNTSTGEARQAYTNQFGKYRFDGLPVGDFYIVTVSSHKVGFVNGTRSFTLDDAIGDLDFTASAP